MYWSACFSVSLSMNERRFAMISPYSTKSTFPIITYNLPPCQSIMRDGVSAPCAVHVALLSEDDESRLDLRHWNIEQLPDGFVVDFRIVGNGLHDASVERLAALPVCPFDFDGPMPTINLIFGC